MEPTLKDGDRILVNKMKRGARLFDVVAALNGEQVKIRRMPGYGDFERNDVLVFNFPYGRASWDSIHMDVMLYYVKRCIALPGDTLDISEGMYHVRGCDEPLGNIAAQHRLAAMPHPEEQGIVVKTFPHDDRLGWNIREFGPLPIPKAGQVVAMDSTNFLLYRQLIDREQKQTLRRDGNQVMMGDSLITTYRFEQNYYFVSGDKMENSQDSRYWGMLPEEYIVGKAVRIWNSKDRYTGETNWERVWKRIE
jgi:signal peptidase I